MVLWAQNNSDLYPMPSQIDKGNNTLANADVKDIPRHIVSVMIYNGFFSPELCVSPAEAYGNIKAYDKYAYSEPQGAAQTKLALWDPAFKNIKNEKKTYNPTTNNDPGNLSYAFMPPVGNRRPKWSNTFQSTEAIVGNRGPSYTSSGSGATLTWALAPASTTGGEGTTEVGLGSNTLLIHGGRTTWEGNISYNDNHVNFETRPDPESTPFTFTSLPAGQKTQFDNLFVNELDTTRAKDVDQLNAASGNSASWTNNFLRTWWDANTPGTTGAQLTTITAGSGCWYD
jgi:hypothetical protein